tara:strand:- start:163 stop:447 length:285 start_codon:yes stop_codon:yes gene_type:complete
MRLKPMNRHLLIELIEHEEQETDLGILLPENYKPTLDHHAAVRLLDTASDCNQIGNLVVGSTFIVNRSMIEEVSFNGKKYHVILENHIIGRLDS